jgi:hypothetical protein
MQKEFKIKRASALFNPVADTPFKVSRSGIESFVQCPRCFILDRVDGIRQPSGAPFTLNSLVDTLLKKEFDLHRAAGTPHPLMVRGLRLAVGVLTSRKGAHTSPSTRWHSI